MPPHLAVAHAPKAVLVFDDFFVVADVEEARMVEHLRRILYDIAAHLIVQTGRDHARIFA